MTDDLTERLLQQSMNEAVPKETRVICGDAREPSLVNTNSVDCVVTSPPYFGLRSYGGSEFEIGRDSLDQYLEDIQIIASNLMWWVRDTGTVWLNIGDTASGSGGAGGDFKSSGSKSDIPKYKQGASGIAKGQWSLGT